MNPTHIIDPSNTKFTNNIVHEPYKQKKKLLYLGRQNTYLNIRRKWLYQRWYSRKSKIFCCTLEMLFRKNYIFVSQTSDQTFSPYGAQHFPRFGFLVEVSPVCYRFLYYMYFYFVKQREISIQKLLFICPSEVALYYQYYYFNLINIFNFRFQLQKYEKKIDTYFTNSTPNSQVQIRAFHCHDPISYLIYINFFKKYLLFKKTNHKRY